MTKTISRGTDLLRLGAMVSVALLLSGCVAPTVTPKAAPVLGGAMQVGVPAGYCIDRAAGREDADTAIIVMGKCREGTDALPAVLTTAIGPAASAGVLAGGGKTLAAYFTSNAGRAALSRSGRASTVTIVQAKSVGTAFIMRIRDSSTGEYWRGVEPVAGRLVTITVDAPGADAAAGEALLTQSLAAMHRANP
jgi:hypothetical protein